MVMNSNRLQSYIKNLDFLRLVDKKCQDHAYLYGQKRGLWVSPASKFNVQRALNPNKMYAYEDSMWS